MNYEICPIKSQSIMTEIATFLELEDNPSDNYFRLQYGYGYIYIILFENGIVKIGKTKNLENRLNTIALSAGMVSPIASIWTSNIHYNYSKNEQLLLNEFRWEGMSEYIRNIFMDDVISFAENSLIYEFENEHDFNKRKASEDQLKIQLNDRFDKLFFRRFSQLIEDLKLEFDKKLEETYDYDAETSIYYLNNTIGVELNEGAYNVIYCPSLYEEFVFECQDFKEVSRICINLCSNKSDYVKSILYKKYQPLRIEGDKVRI